MRQHTFAPTHFLPASFTLRGIGVGAALLPALLLLILPFVPMPGDHPTEMKVKVSDGVANSVRKFSVPTFESTCAEVKLAIANEDRGSGAYTKIKC